jgi:hypothetical protein
MEPQQRPKGFGKHYKMTEIRNGQMVERVLTRQQRDRLNPNDVDVQIDEPRHEISIKHKGSTESKPYKPGEMRGIGTSEWNLLVEAVLSAGDVVELKRKDGCVHQRVRRLRRLFRDTKNAQWFLVTVAAASYGIAINTARSWRFIEALAE